MPTLEAFANPQNATTAPCVAAVKSLEPESLFDRFGWFYALLRERFFRDDTDGIAVALWPTGAPPPGHRLLEVGCGPGFYARRFARRFPHLQVIGIDRSEVQLRHAQQAAGVLANCTFIHGNISDIELASMDGILAVRLFTVARRRAEAMAAMHRFLKPGGRCVIAEPHGSRITHLPLQALWGLARVESLWRRGEPFREPTQVNTFTPQEFTQLIGEQPWSSVSRWQDKHYQYAICEKRGASIPSAESGDYVI